MEKVINLKTEHNYTSIQIGIDNSTEYKRFGIVQITNKEKATSIEISYSKEGLDIGEITLVGREIELLKEFINQH